MLREERGGYLDDYRTPAWLTTLGYIVSAVCGVIVGQWLS